MKKKTELAFYDTAYEDNTTRVARGYAWPYEPSLSVRTLVGINKLINGKGKRALDIGCGDGRHVAYFRSLGYDTTGVDFSRNAVAICKQRFQQDRGVRIVRADLTTEDALDELGQFDLVLEWSVMGHIRRDKLKKYLANVDSAVKPQGNLLSSQFAHGCQGIFKNKDYKTVKGHYTRVFSNEEIANIFPDYEIVDSVTGIVETPAGYSPQIKFNSTLLRK